MVDLEDIELSEPPSESTTEFTKVLSSNEIKYQICRLCLQKEYVTNFNKIVDIFEEADIFVEKENEKSLERILYELFNIKYDKSCQNLPHIICHRCWDMVQAFNTFRSLVQKCEELLQKRLKLMETNAFLSDNEESRPGLNGNPGVFICDINCEIEEVNPEQDFESSEDDFSMESDTEPEDIAATNSNANVNKTSNKKLSGTSDCGTAMNTEVNIPNEVQTPSVPVEYKNFEFIVKNTYSCQYCDMSFSTQNDRTEHESRHDPNAPFICNFCPMRCTSRQSLINHIKDKHDAERPFVCVICNKGFCRRSDLKKHSIVHTGVRPFACPICTKSFSRNTNLTKHLRTHSSIKPFGCQYCTQSFATAQELTRHGRTHSEIKAFKCSKCSATFSRKDKLQIHEQTHYRNESEFLLNQGKQVKNQEVLPNSVDNIDNMIISINPYVNSDMNVITPLEDLQRSSFTGNQLVQTKPTLQHIKVAVPTKSHSRLHICDICNKSFTRERDLHRHKGLHIDSLFTCKQCGVGFSRREKLVRHELEQHAPQYSCEICRATFHKREELETHFKMHELQQSAGISAHQVVINAANVVSSPVDLTNNHHISVSQSLTQPQPLPATGILPSHRPTPGDMSFYRNMVPTMNLGFYSETRPEDRNGI